MRVLTIATLTLAFAAGAWAGVGITVNIGAPPYYGYPPPDVVYVERYIPAPYVPQVFIVSRYAGISPIIVVDLYRHGWGWDRICSRYRVPAEAFYGYGRHAGPPYGHAYGFYGERPGKWKDHYYERDYDRDYDRDRGHGHGRGHDRDHDRGRGHGRHDD